MTGSNDKTRTWLGSLGKTWVAAQNLNGVRKKQSPPVPPTHDHESLLQPTRKDQDLQNRPVQCPAYAPTSSQDFLGPKGQSTQHASFQRVQNSTRHPHESHMSHGKSKYALSIVDIDKMCSAPTGPRTRGSFSFFLRARHERPWE